MTLLDPDHTPQPIDSYRGVEIFLRWRDKTVPTRRREFYCTAVRKTRVWNLRGVTINELKSAIDDVLDL
jgi:hypothetical protein